MRQLLKSARAYFRLAAQLRFSEQQREIYRKMAERLVREDQRNRKRSTLKQRGSPRSWEL